MIRYEFIDGSIRQEDIHPCGVFEKEKELANKFVSRLEFPNTMNSCPFCKEQISYHENIFNKWGVAYTLCPKTWTISIGSIVDDDVLVNYNNSSELSQFRASKEYQKESSKRRRDLWENFIEWMEGRIHRYLGKGKFRITDWGGGLTGWIDCLEASSFTKSLFIEDSLPPLTHRPNNGERVDIICMMGVFNRVAEPDKLLKRIYSKLKTGGLLFITCRSGSGFDILTLLESSDTIYPLDHIFLPSPKGMGLLLEEAGFDIIEITTPGLMDINYIKTVKDKIPEHQYFLRYILAQDDVFLFERMQSFLQTNNLSSHLRCLAIKR